MPTRSFPNRLFWRCGQALLLIIAVYLVIRGIVEIVTVDPTRPATYRHDWGGPHFLGVLAVHLGPALLVLGGAVWYGVHRRRHRPAPEQQ